MFDEKKENKEKKLSILKGDPNDTTLRKVEENVVIPKMILEEAEKRCSDYLKVLLDCAENSSLLFMFKCREEKNARNDCLSQWTRNPEFKKEITEKYLYARSYYRRTGQPLYKYVKHK